MAVPLNLRCARARGFTLLEMSIVLVIIALVTGMALQAGVSVVATARVTATQQKMAAIDQALLQYRNANGRLPCPGDLTLTTTSSNFGLEAGAGSGSAIGIGTGVCTGTGMLPQANFTATGATNTSAKSAEGAFPALTLGLPADFMVDGWGNRFRYAVDVSMTKPGTFASMGLGCPPVGAITVKDSTGNARSTGSIYALISHGPNGHGAYTSNGAVVNTGSANANELVNCHCSSTGATTTSSGVQTSNPATYVQANPSTDPNNALDAFDDLVSYKERWQMAVTSDKTTVSGCGIDYLSIGVTVGYPYLFYINNGAVTQLPAPSQYSSWSWYNGGTDFSADDKTLAWGGSMYSSNYATAGLLFSVAKTGLTYSATNIAEADGIDDLRISPDGNYMAVEGAQLSGSNQTTASNEFIRLYSKGSSAPYFSTMVGYVTAHSYSWHSAILAWSPDGNTLYSGDFGNQSPLNDPNGIDVYVHSGNSLTYSNTIFSDNGWVTAISVHPSGNYLAAGGTGPSSYGPYVIANPTSATPTQISVAGSGLAANYSYAAGWSPDGNFLSASPSGTSVAVYGFNSAGPGGVYFTPETVSGNTCAWGYAAITGGNFSSDSYYFAVVTGNSGNDLCIFERNSTGTVWTQIYGTHLGLNSASKIAWSK
jgi:prepilin-type N-terminal cleavage/methylation domain-containing protein